MNKPIFMLACLMALLVLGGCDDQQQDNGFQEAQELQEAGDYAAAFEKYDAVLAQAPTNLDAAGGAGVCAYHLNRFEDAIVYLGEALSHRNPEPDWYWFRAMAFMNSGNTKRGVFKLEKLLKRQPNLIPAWVELAHRSLRQREWGDFRDYMWECGKKGADTPEYAVLKAVRNAIDDEKVPVNDRWREIDSLSSASPTDTNLAYLEAMLRIDAGQPEAALAALDRLTAAGGSPLPWQRARALGQSGQFEAAESILNGLEADDVRTVQARTEINMQKGDISAARAYLKAASPDFSEEAHTEEELEVLSLVLDFLILGPDSVNSFSQSTTPFTGGRFAVLLYQKRLINGELIEKIEKDWDFVLGVAPFNPLVRYFHARTLLDEGRYEEACEEWEVSQALGLSTRYGPVLGRKFARHCDG